MKRILLTLMTLLGVTGMWADEIKIADVEVLQGGTGTMKIEMVNTSGTEYRSFQFDIHLPEGITLVSAQKGEALTAEVGDYIFKYEDRGTDGVRYGFVYSDFGGTVFTEGVIVELELKADESLAVGTTLQAKFTGDADVRSGGSQYVQFGTEGDPVDFEDFTANIVILENRITLDETATELPSETGLQNVLVKRTIKAGQWNTICLPFAMDADQLAQAFPDGVQLADFTGCEADYPEDADYATSIKVKFQSVTEMEANHPYLIKVETPVTYEEGFKVDAVTIDPAESVSVDQDEDSYKKLGKTYYTYNSFIGTYVANTEIPAGSIILSGNKFYYTKGTTTKGFRGWFYFENCSTSDIDLATAEVKIFIDDDATAIETLNQKTLVEGVYDLSGRKIQIENGEVNTLQKGVYIINGKKVTIK